MTNPITPQELGLVDEFRNDESEKQSLIKHINHFLQLHKNESQWFICAVGIFAHKPNWISLANEVIVLFRQSGWTITDEFIFFSFQTRVEFIIYKTR